MYIGIYMKFIELKSHDPYLNLAIEEYIFKNAEEETFILWQNEPCIVIGKNQNPFAEINIPKAREKNVKIVRRITGGGAVYHDLGNVNYSFISPSHKEGIDFAYFTSPIIKALSSLGVSCILSGRNDLVLKNGRKISGNAQHSSLGRVLHHGTLLFSSDLDVLDSLLNVDAEKLKSKAVRSVRSRVANISDSLDFSCSLTDFILSIKRMLTEEYSATEVRVPDNAEIQLIRERNSSDEWIFNEKEYLSVYNIKVKNRFDFGTVECNIKLKGDYISDIRITGDFFEKRPIEELEERLIGKSITSTHLDNCNVSDYILGMSNSDFLQLLKDL